MNEISFSDLFVLDLANNHQGDVEHGRTIIRQLGDVARDNGVRAAIKFQFRDLDTFIHPSAVDNTDYSHIGRFLSTRLDWDAFADLKQEVTKSGMLSICTPFDEASVQRIIDMDFDYIKIASCSARDWPLLEAAARAYMSVIVSTGGLHTSSIDDLVSFFEHRGVPHALMHCVSIYPTPADQCQLEFISTLRERYPKHVIGWSTHEDPDELSAVQVAYAKGARMFERHVGLATESIKLNKYSSNPEQIGKWFKSWHHVRELCGSEDTKMVTEQESQSLESLQRGIYCRRNVKRDSIIERDDVEFAMPWRPGQIPSGKFVKGMVATKPLKVGGPVLDADVTRPPAPKKKVIKDSIHEVKALLNRAHVVLNSEFQVEFSHHYGVDKFREIGALIINCINREYCKKIIVQLAGQRHPAHFHKRKEETFQVLYGILESELDGHRKTLHPGETLLIQPGVWHKFWTDTGCVFEEISTTHYNDDSIYNDRRINEMERSARKTVVENWGRWEIDDKIDAN
jgi:N-acetylneuraminate synthase